MSYNIADLFEHAVDSVPDRTALVVGDLKRTYAELDERANRLAHWLQEQGIGVGDHIGIYGLNSEPWIVTMIAAFKIRAIPININYRYVSTTVHCDELMMDVDKVVQYCIDNSEKWQVRKNKIIIGGHSAGAHMSLMYGYAYDTRGVIGGIISVAGPTNFYDETMIQTVLSQFPWMLFPIQLLANATYVSGKPVPENFRKISPVTRIKNVPTLMIHGTKDELVDYSTVVAFEAELKKKGVVNKLFTINDADHSFTNISNQMKATMNLEMSNWIKKYGE